MKKNSSSSVIYRPQPGPQSQFLASTADIVFYGGAAGGGKTYGMLLDPLRHAIALDEFHGVIFRRESTELRKPGSIWSESQKIYPCFKGESTEIDMNWKFKKGVDIKFSGLQYESDLKTWHGAQLDYIGFDEVTTFTEQQFWYLFSRLRSTSGNIKPYIRATCNPEPCWVLDIIDWWIGKDGYPIKERSGVLRYFVRISDVLMWFDSYEDAANYCVEMQLPEQVKPKSLTFIPASVNDNKILLKNNPDYISTLYSLPEIDRMRLLGGNWRIKPSGKLFKIESFRHFTISPKYSFKRIYVDTAQETKTANDYTVMQVWGKFENKIYLERQFRGKVEFNDQLLTLISLIQSERPQMVCIEKKANGSALIQSLRRELVSLGIVCGIKPIERNKDKYTRGFSAQSYVESGYVHVNPVADYYPEFISEVSQFSPENKNRNGVHDDQVDCAMDAIEDMLHNSGNDDNVTQQKLYHHQNAHRPAVHFAGH